MSRVSSVVEQRFCKPHCALPPPPLTSFLVRFHRTFRISLARLSSAILPRVGELGGNLGGNVCWSSAQDNKKKGEQTPALFCFTNCCHGGFGYSRSYHRPQLLDRMERRRMAWGPYCKFLDRSHERDHPMSSAAETADDGASSQARGY